MQQVNVASYFFCILGRVIKPLSCYGLDKIKEKWMWIEDGACVFGMELGADIPRVFWDFDDLDEATIRVFADTLHAG